MGEPTLMTAARAAEILGCHPETIRRAIRSERLSCYRFGGCTRISPEHLQSYLDAALCPARDQTDLSSSPTEANSQSSGGREDRVAAFRLEQRMNAALDRPSRTKPPKRKQAVEPNDA
jgi:excisionase family DNA binding protein